MTERNKIFKIKLMKLFFFLLFVISVDFGFPSTVQAVYSNGQPISNATKRDIQFRRNKIAKSLNQQYLSKSRLRLEKYKNLLGKLVTRRNKLQESGADVERLDALLGNARQKYTETERGISDTAESFTRLDFAAQDVSNLKSDILSDYDTIKRLFISLHTAVADTLAEIKALSIRNE